MPNIRPFDFSVLLDPLLNETAWRTPLYRLGFDVTYIKSTPLSSSKSNAAHYVFLGAFWTVRMTFGDTNTKAVRLGALTMHKLPLFGLNRNLVSLHPLLLLLIYFGLTAVLSQNLQFVVWLLTITVVWTICERNQWCWTWMIIRLMIVLCLFLLAVPQAQLHMRSYPLVRSS